MLRSKRGPPVTYTPVAMHEKSPLKRVDCHLLPNKVTPFDSRRNAPHKCSPHARSLKVEQVQRLIYITVGDKVPVSNITTDTGTGRGQVPVLLS